MKVLIIAKQKESNISPFVQEQAESLSKLQIKIEVYPLRGKSITGYLKNCFGIRKYIKARKPDIIHAHYGLNGFIASIQRKVPVVTTFHGSDIHNRKVRLISFLTYHLSARSIFVSKKMAAKIKSRHPIIIPCGIDVNVFKPFEVSKKELGLNPEMKHILFSSSFDNRIKNYTLAKEAINYLNDSSIQLIELKGYTREDVAKLMNGVDIALMTSKAEGSPQFIKEAMACNLPIVSTDVGDVKYLLQRVNGCFVSKTDQAPDLAEKIKNALFFAQKHGRTSGRRKLLDQKLDTRSIARRIIEVYNEILKDK